MDALFSARRERKLSGETDCSCTPASDLHLLHIVLGAAVLEGAGGIKSLAAGAFSRVLVLFDLQVVLGRDCRLVGAKSNSALSESADR